MRTMRFMSLLFLVLSLAFFLVPEFRQGLQAPVFALEDFRWLERAGKIPPEKLRTLAQQGEQQRDAETLAFVALHTGDLEEKFRLSVRAASLDAKLTWIFWNAGGQAMRDPHGDERRARLLAWDSQNAIPLLFQAEQIFEKQNLGRFRNLDQSKIEELARETAWREAMAKAFAAPRYDSYSRSRFELERVILRRNGLDRPVVVLASLATYSIPNMLSVRTYGRLLVALGKEAEKAGRLPEAIAHYWTVAHFGERMELHSPVLIERLIGIALQNEAHEQLVPALRAMDRTQEALTIEHGVQQRRQRMNMWSGKYPLAQSSNYHWSVLMSHLFAGLVFCFGLFSVLTAVYASLKRWLRPEKQGPLFRFLMGAENYAPVLFFLACVGLYVNYYPYALNFNHYMTAGGDIHDLEPFFYNVFPTFGGVPGRTALPLGKPFRPYIWYALAGVVLVLILTRRRSAADEPVEAPKAAPS